MTLLLAGSAAGAHSSTQALSVILSLLLGFIGAAASVISIWAPRRSNEQPVRNRKVPTVRFWRPTNYNLALGHLQAMVERWENKSFDVENRRGFVTEYDLVRWIIQLALTCAANIVPQSLGKASLFRIGDIQFDREYRVTSVRVYSFELDGIFTAEQMIDGMNHSHMRNIRISLEQHDSFPAALQCVRAKEPTLQSLRQRASNFDKPELKLGLTHILAIPLRHDFAEAVPDQPVSITVDLRFGWPVRYLVDTFGLHSRTLNRRANRLHATLARVSALQRPEFLPPPAPNRGMPR